MTLSNAAPLKGEAIHVENPDGSTAWFDSTDAKNEWVGNGQMGIGARLFEVGDGFYLQLSFSGERFAAKRLSHEHALRWLLENNHQPPASLAALAERQRIRTGVES